MYFREKLRKCETRKISNKNCTFVKAKNQKNHSLRLIRLAAHTRPVLQLHRCLVLRLIRLAPHTRPVLQLHRNSTTTSRCS